MNLELLFAPMALFIAGLVSMVYSTFSGGGALLTLPALIFVGAAPATAVAVNRFAIFIQSLVRFPFLHGKLNLGAKIPAALVLAHTFGAILGAIILVSLESGVALPVLGAILIIGALVTMFSPKGIKAAEKKEITIASILASSVCVFATGIYRGFFGPAAGIFNRLIFVNVLRLDFVQSLVLSNYSTILSSLAALIIFFNAGIIDFSLALPLTVGTVIGALIGTKFALEKGNAFMKYAFVALSALAGIYFIFFKVGA